ncbi:DUF1566 domain-containing protein [bacterium]|nr:DUF1566 domain-containing protein [bacterium]
MNKNIAKSIITILILSVMASCGGSNSGNSSSESDVALAKEALTFDTIKKENSSASNILTDLTLPKTGNFETNIFWSTDDNQTITTEGVVTRPAYSAGNKTVNLSASINKGSETAIKKFTVTVIEQTGDDTESVEAAKNDLKVDLILEDNSAASNVLTDLTLPTTGSNGTSITWSSSDRSIITEDGSITRPSYSDGDKTVTLTATITKGTESSTISYTFTVIALPQNATEAVSAAKEDLLQETILNENSAVNNVKNDLSLPNSGSNETTIVWSSSDETVISNNGEVSRPTFFEGDQTITLTATITKDGATETKSFTITVIKLPQSDEEAVAIAKNDLTFDSIKNDNTAVSSILTNLTLPTSGSDGTAISWVSNDESTISTAGTVTRPSYSTGNLTVTLTATISKGTELDSESYTLTVIKLTQTDEEAVAAAKANLTFDTIKNLNMEEDMIFSALNLSENGSEDTMIEWFTTNSTVIAVDGTINRPSSGTASVSLTANISIGSSSSNKQFDLVVTSPINLPDTGQTLCYNNSGTIITCPDPGSELAQDGSYEFIAKSFTDNGDETITDNNTGLIWELKTSDNKNDQYNWQGAYDYCDTSELAGNNDWRLPNPVELSLILDMSKNRPPIDLSVFPNAINTLMWTSQEYDINGDDSNANAWYIPFHTGPVFSTGKSQGSVGVRCVRGTQSVPAEEYSDYGDGTVVKDNRTGLIWVKGETTSRNWADAISYCEQTESAGGYTDWRLPSRNELISIIKYNISKTVKGIDDTIFTNVSDEFYWSSTTFQDSYYKAWRIGYSDSAPGVVAEDYKYSNAAIRCVRGR